jgi:hypothetical protein
MRAVISIWLGTLASVAGLFFTLHPANTRVSTIQAMLIGLAIAGFVTMITLDIRDYYRRRPKAYRTKEEINRYMHQWINKGGRVVIFTRDMSWAIQSEIRDLLLQKAAANELTICLPSHITLADELAQAGAEIITYEGLNYIPRSRFTIINKDRTDAQIAVGRLIDKKHVIEEYAEGAHPVFAVANDLVEILRRLPQ